MAKKRYFGAWLRHPRTTQEIRANLDKHDRLVRGKRRNLPTSYDDLFVHQQKSWKYKRRKTQYRENSNNFSWHELRYEWHERKAIYKIVDQLQTLGCYFEWLGRGIRWYGPDL